jgi:hypothetical protein
MLWQMLMAANTSALWLQLQMTQEALLEPPQSQQLLLQLLQVRQHPFLAQPVMALQLFPLLPVALVGQRYLITSIQLMEQTTQH